MTTKMMDNKQKTANLLGLARKAGKLVTGEDLVTKAIQNQTVKLVFLAADASSNLHKKITDKSSYYEVPVCQAFTEDELSQAIGQARKVVAITDGGFAKKMESLMNM